MRLLSLENITGLLKNLLLERGLYLVCCDQSTAFHLVEALTNLLYPLKWELPKIVGYQPNYTFFESPLPLIYSFDLDTFSQHKVDQLELVDKCILYVESNVLVEHSRECHLPSKPLANLLKGLESVAGKYLKAYQSARATLSPDQLTRLVHDESDLEVFEYWAVRECFFAFMTELMADYHSCFKEQVILESPNLESSQIFDFVKFAKSKTDLKANDFMAAFIRTGSFSRFVESRVSQDTAYPSAYMEYFDSISQKKRENPKTQYIDEFLIKRDQCLSRLVPVIPKDSEVYSYQGRFPTLREKNFPQSVGASAEGGAERLLLPHGLDLLDLSHLVKASDDTFARKNLEALYTLWIIALKIAIIREPRTSSDQLVEFAFNRFRELEEEKIIWNIVMVQCLAFVFGVSEQKEKLQKLMKKAAKVIKQTNQSISVLREFVWGRQLGKQRRDQLIEEQGVFANEKEQLPISIESYFETNAFCLKCGTYIPEEIILARIIRGGVTSTISKCPNQACLHQYEPSFSRLILKEQGSERTAESTPLMAPLLLFKGVKGFLEGNWAQLLFEVSTVHQKRSSGQLYWNLMFYMNFINLPAFFFERRLGPRVMDCGRAHLCYYSFDAITTLKSKNTSHSTTANSEVMNTETQNRSMGEARIGTFSVKKDL